MSLSLLSACRSLRSLVSLQSLGATACSLCAGALKASGSFRSRSLRLHFVPVFGLFRSPQGSGRGCGSLRSPAPLPPPHCRGHSFRFASLRASSRQASGHYPQPPAIFVSGSWLLLHHCVDYLFADPGCYYITALFIYLRILVVIT